MELNSHLIQELKLKSASSLRDSLPLYPTVRREEVPNKIGKEIGFSTLVRKKYDGVYYLIPFRVTDATEAKAIHALHAYVYKYLMLGVKTLLEVKDEDQTNEVTRLKNL
jgi:hypothetical protein